MPFDHARSRSLHRALHRLLSPALGLAVTLLLTAVPAGGAGPTPSSHGNAAGPTVGLPRLEGLQAFHRLHEVGRPIPEDVLDRLPRLEADLARVGEELKHALAPLHWLAYRMAAELAPAETLGLELLATCGTLTERRDAQARLASEADGAELRQQARERRDRLAAEIVRLEARSRELEHRVAAAIERHFGPGYDRRVESLVMDRLEPLLASILPSEEDAERLADLARKFEDETGSPSAQERQRLEAELDSLLRKLVPEDEILLRLREEVRAGVDELQPAESELAALREDLRAIVRDLARGG